jgi:hypothetical protein
MWNVTVDELDFVDSDSFDVAKINMNVKVTFLQQRLSYLLNYIFNAVFPEMHGHTI